MEIARRRLTALALLAMAVAVVSFPGISPAAEGIFRDARRDAKAPWDITKLVVRNGADDLRVEIDYRGTLRLGGGTGLLVNLMLDFGDPSDSVYEGDFTIDMLRGSTVPGAADRLHLYRHREYDTTRVGCPGLRVQVGRRAGELRFSAPQSCFGGLAGRVRVGGHSYRPRAAPDEADYLRDWSRWIGRG